MPEKHQYFDNHKFTRDERTGYYLCSKKSENGVRKRMHVYVWEYYNGPVLDGYHVHHIDEDKSNNDINNLKLIKKKEHLSKHAKENVIRNPEAIKKRVKRMQPFAAEWHRSEAGREWHKMHYNSMRDKMHVKKIYSCDNCGKVFVGANTGKNRFCSNSCKSAWRRSSGIDDIMRKCEYCGKEFKVNKYAKRKFCSKECSFEAVPRGGRNDRNRKDQLCGTPGRL